MKELKPAEIGLQIPIGETIEVPAELIKALSRLFDADKQLVAHHISVADDDYFISISKGIAKAADALEVYHDKPITNRKRIWSQNILEE